MSAEKISALAIRDIITPEDVEKGVRYTPNGECPPGRVIKRNLPDLGSLGMPENLREFNRKLDSGSDVSCTTPFTLCFIEAK